VIPWGAKKIVRKVRENPITFPLDQHPKKSGEKNKYGNGGDNHEASSFAYFCYRSFMLDQSRSGGNACTYHIRGRGGSHQLEQGGAKEYSQHDASFD
jgi:hypothetical protein